MNDFDYGPDDDAKVEEGDYEYEKKCCGSMVGGNAVLESKRRKLDAVELEGGQSCGYDAFFTVLGHLWMENSAAWSVVLGRLSPVLTVFAANMGPVKERRITFESARNTARRNLHVGDPITTAVDHIAQSLLQSMHYAVGRQHCTNTCGHFDDETYGILESYMSSGLKHNRDYSAGVPMQDWLGRYLVTGRERWARCLVVDIRNKMKMTIYASGEDSQNVVGTAKLICSYSESKPFGKSNKISGKNWVTSNSCHKKVVTKRRAPYIRDVPPEIFFYINHLKLKFNRVVIQVKYGGGRIKLKLRGVVYGSLKMTAGLGFTTDRVWMCPRIVLFKVPTI
ncbi:hypothetical protein DFH09DRAFT_1096521 [Mycena vulgaris]|nr:hypothetical protein DFH09DRAFT_1096521 [Mycena vulgaris]